MYNAITEQLFDRIVNGKVDAVAIFDRVENEGEIQEDRYTSKMIMLLTEPFLALLCKRAEDHAVAYKNEGEEEGDGIAGVPVFRGMRQERLKKIRACTKDEM